MRVVSEQVGAYKHLADGFRLGVGRAGGVQNADADLLQLGGSQIFSCQLLQVGGLRKPAAAVQASAFTLLSSRGVSGVKSRLFWYHGRSVPVQALLTAL